MSLAFGILGIDVALLISLVFFVIFVIFLGLFTPSCCTPDSFAKSL